MLNKNTVIRRTDTKNPEIWRVVGDYREVDTPNDFELVKVDNTDVWDMFSERIVREKLESGEWRKVNL